MTRQAWLAVAIVTVPLLAYVATALADGAPRFPTRAECIRAAVEGEPVDLVYGRFDTIPAAEELRDRVIAVGFTGTELLADGCGRWKVVLESVPSIDVAAEIQEEAASVDLEPTLELGSDG